MRTPLQGIKVLDLSWVMVGPYSARYLAGLGADVVKVESSLRIDPLRTLGPFKDGVPGPERSVSYHNLNSGKRSITIDLKSEDGRDVILRLVRWADVVLESFTPRVLESLSLTYEHLREVRPDLVMVSTSIGGRTGPYSNRLTGVGTMGASLSGATFLIGWPDRPPAGPFGPWTDEVAPRFIVSSILSALHRRRSTGEGCAIDVSQAEAGMQFISPAAWAYAANGAVPQRVGSSSPLRSPCGSYRSKGNDEWVTLDASGEPAWAALRKIISGSLLDHGFDTLLGRLRNRDALDGAIEAWTSLRTSAEAETVFQQAGIPAHAVVRAGQIAVDPDVRASDHLQPIDDPILGTAEIEQLSFRLARTPITPARRGPLIGEHTYEVLRECACLSDEEIAHLAASGALR